MNTCHWTDQFAPFTYFVLMTSLLFVCTAALLFGIGYVYGKVKHTKRVKRIQRAHRREYDG